MDATVFGHRLRHFRRRRGLTLAELGSVVGRPAPYLSLVENGRREPKLSLISALAAAVGVTPAELLDPEPPNPRARLEMELEQAQSDPRYLALGLPHLKASTRLPDDAIRHVVTLFRELVAGDTRPAAEELKRANARLGEWLRGRDGYLEPIEDLARRALLRVGHAETGPLTTRTLTDLAAAFGFEIHSVEDVPHQVRSVTDLRNRRIYIAQRNELRTRQARKAVLQTIGAFALGASEGEGLEGHLRRRLETSYFAAAVLMPEPRAVALMDEARAAGDLSVEDLKEAFYVSYEMAAQRFTNLATRHLGIRTHFIRSDETGTIGKAYHNDDLPLPTDRFGGAEGLRLCREWGGRAAYRSEDRYAIHYQYTETPAGSFWCATHLEPDATSDAITFGVPAADAGTLRGGDVTRRRRSLCPDGACCRPPARLAARWEGQVVASARSQSRIAGLLTPDPRPRVDVVDVYDLVDRHQGN